MQAATPMTSPGEAVKEKRRYLRFWNTGKMDLSFFALILVIQAIGLIMLFSASYANAYAYSHNSYEYIASQGKFALIGILAMLFISKIDYHILRLGAWFLYIASVVMLILVLILPPVNPESGVKRWLGNSSFSFQPSEIAKFAIILLFAHLISLHYKRMEKPGFGVFFFTLLLGIICGLVVVETHLSATILIFMIGIGMMIVGGAKLRYLVGIGVVCAGIGALLIIFKVVPYGGSRIEYWLDPWSAPGGEGWQTIQSLISIGSGGLFGRGLGQSRQKYLWVPEPQNDFIFAIVAEEVGLFGCLLIVGLFIALIWRGFTIAKRARDKFGAMLVVGIIGQVSIQTILNIAVVTNTLPNTGISLPFFSYGGSALLMLLAEMGVVLSVSRSTNMVKP